MKPRPLSVAALLLLCCTATAAPRYTASQIGIEEIRDYRTADVNGDGRGDLLVSTWSEQAGRELLLFWQGEDGRFPGSPSQRIEIKTDIVAIGFADVRDTPGTELLFVTRAGVYSFSTVKESYANNLKKLLDFDFINAVPQERSVEFLPPMQDLNGDGRADLLLPGRKQFSWFARGDGENFAPAEPLPAPYFSPANRRNSADVDFSVEQGLQLTISNPSDFEDLVEEPRLPAGQKPDRNDERGFVLDVERWLAPISALQLNGDGRTDLLFVDDSPRDEQFIRRVNVLFQSEQNDYGDSVDWNAELRIRDDLYVADLDGDELDDVIVIEGRTTDSATVYFYLNAGGKFDFDKPTQVMRFSGYDTTLTFKDLNGDGVPELLVSVYSISAVEAVRGGNLVRTLLIYAGGDGDNLYQRRPSYKLTEKFSADNFRGLAQRHSFKADVNGDGHIDAVALDEQGALAAKAIAADLRIADEAFWRFVPDHLVQAFRPLNLNADQASDFVLRHQRALTVLVSQP